MSTTATATPPRKTLPKHSHGIAVRALAAVSMPGGAVFLLAIALLVATIIANPNFGDPGVVIRFFGRTAPIAIAAIGQYYVIVSGEFDLSMGAVIAAQVVIAGNFIGDDTGRNLIGLGFMLGFGAFIGLINGLVTTLLLVPSFIVTLAMMLALTGLVRYQSGGAADAPPNDDFRQLGRGVVEDVPIVEVIPYPLIVLTVLCVAAAWLMRRPFGRTLLAVGDNPQAAHVAGSRVWWVKTRAFMLSSVAATISGVLLVGYAGVHPSVGQGYEFAAITAVVLGGVVLGGGRGWVLSAAAGAFALELLFTLLTVLEVESTWRDTVQGLIIIVAVALAGRAWTFGRQASSGGLETVAEQPPRPPEGTAAEQPPRSTGGTVAGQPHRPPEGLETVAEQPPRPTDVRPTDATRPTEPTPPTPGTNTGEDR